MAGDNNVGGSHAHDETRGMEVLRVSLLTQETVLTILPNSVGHKFQTYEPRFDEIVSELDALSIGANRNRIDDRRLGQGQPINMPVPAHRHRQTPSIVIIQRRKTSCLAIISL